MPGIGPGGTPGHEIELLEQMAYDLIGLVLFTQLVELRHHLRERLLDIADGALGIVLTLRVKTTLTTYELFSVKI